MNIRTKEIVKDIMYYIGQKIVVDVYRWRDTPYHNIVMLSVYLYLFLLLYYERLNITKIITPIGIFINTYAYWIIFKNVKQNNSDVSRA